MTFHSPVEAYSARKVYTDPVDESFSITHQQLWDHMSGVAWAPWLNAQTSDPDASLTVRDRALQPRAARLSDAVIDAAPLSVSHVLDRDPTLRNTLLSTASIGPVKDKPCVFAWRKARDTSALEYMPTVAATDYNVRLDDRALQNPCSWIGHCQRVIGRHGETCTAVVSRLAPRLAEVLHARGDQDLTSDASIYALAEQCARKDTPCSARSLEAQGVNA